MATFIENLQGFMAQARDAENAHHEKMIEICNVTLEKVTKNDLDEDISDDLRMVSNKNWLTLLEVVMK